LKAKRCLIFEKKDQKGKMLFCKWLIMIFFISKRKDFFSEKISRFPEKATAPVVRTTGAAPPLHAI